MTYDNAEFIGKSVKDIYGSYMGKVAGTITEIDGSIQSVGVDCGSAGLRMIPGEHLVIQGGVVIFIPKWRLDSQRLLREKQLVLRRLRAMIEIVAGNDEMRVDAEIVQERYRTKLVSLQKAADDLKATLDSRLAELEDQSRSAKTLFFDAKIQYKSNEIEENVFETARRSTNDLIEHVSHEIAEINNIQERIRGLETEVREVTELTDGAAGAKESAPSIYAHGSATPQDPRSVLPEAPANSPGSHSKDGMVTTVSDKPAMSAGPQTAVTAQSTPTPPQANMPPNAQEGDLKPAAGHPDAGPSFRPKPREFAMSDAVSDTTDAMPSEGTAEPMGQVARSVDAKASAGTAAMPSSTGGGGTDAPTQKAPEPPRQEETGGDKMGSIPMVMPTSTEPRHLQQDRHGGNEPSHDEDVVFPEPPKNSTPAPESKPKSDDDWLSRMASQ